MNILGIDLGTTSVKITVYNVSTGNILHSITRDTDATVSLENSRHHEQNVDKIIDTVVRILHTIDENDLKNIGHIGVSGQMHGVVFWNDDKNDHGIFQHSNLITWMDQRCNEDNFIESLPKMPSYLVDEMMVSTGYGCATIYHFNRFNKAFLDQWKFAGNIVDFFVCQICDTSQPLMSSHMAHSWGYFDLINNSWFTDILTQTDFPVKFLPQVTFAGTIFGKTKNVLQKFPQNAVVYVGMGDLQCSMFRALENNLNSAINVSTSSQFVVRVTLDNLKILAKHDNGLLNLPPGLVINPFFDRDYLLVGASLNGGNVLARFISLLQNWVLDLASVEITKELIWDRLLSKYSSKIRSEPSEKNLLINPTIFGERHCPNVGANVSNLLQDNCDIDNVYEGICRGVIHNLTNLLPLTIISQLSVRQLTCSGGVIRRHKCVEDTIRKIYGSTIHDIKFLYTYDACVGVTDYIAQLIR